MTFSYADHDQPTITVTVDAAECADAARQAAQALADLEAATTRVDSHPDLEVNP